MSDRCGEAQATMLVFSGRPDPTWAISSDDWQTLNKQIHNLQGRLEHTGQYEFPSVLGYRGFQVLRDNEEVYYVAAQKKAVQVKQHCFITYDDPSRSIEEWFFRHAKQVAHIDLPVFPH
jgi:hypothetical protein